MTDRAYAEVSARLYAAADSGEEWPALMRRCVDLLHCDHALILARESWQGAILRGLLDALECGVILVDAASQPLYVNRRAMQALAQLDGLRITPAGLAASTAAKTGELRALISQVIARARVEHCLEPKQRLSVARPSCRSPWLLSVAPLLEHAAGRPSGLELAAIFIEQTARSSEIDAGLLGESFRLTAREAQVAALIASGRDVRAVAGTLGVGIGTVRTHLKHVFDKTGARSQTTLALRLQGFADRS